MMRLICNKRLIDKTRIDEMRNMMETTQMRNMVEYSFLSAALQMATATDIQDIADILGVTFQEHCSATPLKAIKPC